MRTVRINGHVVKCRFCTRDASIIYAKIPICNRCLRAFYLGVRTGRMIEREKVKV